MKKHYTIPILFKIDEQTLGKLDKAIDELGHTRSLFIRDAINRRIFDYEAHERPVILSLKPPAFLARVSGELSKVASAISMAAKPGARDAVWRRHAPVLLSYLIDRGSDTGRPTAAARGLQRRRRRPDSPPSMSLRFVDRSARLTVPSEPPRHSLVLWFRSK